MIRDLFSEWSVVPKRSRTTGNALHSNYVIERVLLLVGTAAF